ncbi:MAG: glycoside hydrolase family 95 protein [Bacteroidales bacterium]
MLLILWAFILISFGNDFILAQSKSVLWFDRPAEHFEETLVLGNGRTGASVFGGVTSDKIYLNDATLWAGEPVNPYMNPDAHKNIPLIREALAREDYKSAEQLNKNIQGKFCESFAPLGTLIIEFDHKGLCDHYYRELDIGKAIAKVNYNLNGVGFSREYFISYPDKVMIIKLSGSKKESLNFKIKFTSLLKYSNSANDSIFQINGYAPYHAEPDYRGEMPDAVIFDEHRGTRFSTFLKVRNHGGQVVITDSAMIVRNADEATLFISVATSFNGFDKDPVRQGLDNKILAKNQLIQAYAKNYESLKEDHLKDFQTYFNRVKLELGGNISPDLPTDERLKKYAKGADDKNLEVLYFQYGRYLLIASSRTNGVPANLQGIWNPYLRPPWSSNYTMNINTEENYWLAECANLSEMHLPFLTFIDNLSKTGKVTAKTFYGVEKGWAACHNSDIWAMSNPVGDFGKGEPMWACWNMSGTWAVTHLWEHYLFTGDMDFLKEKAYPLMKGASEFCLSWLIKNKQGYLVTSPSTSPENTYRTPEGYVGATLYGSTSDISMIRECLDQTIKASHLLNVDASLRDSMKAAMSQLYPYQIGKKGNLQEWYHDWEDADPFHRHQSHLFGLYPGHQITPVKTPELSEACRKTLEIKGDETTGWSKGWRINLWARLWDGNHAYKMFRELLSYVEPDGAKSIEYSGGGGTYPNLFDAHPPFQIDGNFGGAAGVVEMLLQSNEEELFLLPALPDAWSSGSVQGICARGGFELSISWKNGTLESVEVISKTGNSCCLNYKDKRVILDTVKGGVYALNSDLNKIIQSK